MASRLQTSPVFRPFITLEIYFLSAPSMSRRQSKRARFQYGGSYHDRIPLEEDYEVVQARTASLTSRQTAVDSERDTLPSTWTIGASWAPEENFEYSLDADGGWYDEALYANIEDIMGDIYIFKPKKRRSQASVCTSLLSIYCFWYPESPYRRGPMCIGRRLPAIATWMN